ncbi:MAG TPA: carbohydrate ABC transporter permease [Lacipirellulaceae bacterium]|nr:carbohydrate ABC transporter permease [Lacipirellulaceae bacterium]
MISKLQTWILHVVLIAGGLVTVYPLAWMVTASLMPTGEAQSFPPRFWPSHITFAHYADLFERLNMARYFGNSLLVATAVTLLSVLLNSMAGYALAKLRFAGRERIFRFLIAGLVIPAQVAMIPLFLFMKQLGLINTYWAVILPSAASILGIFLIRQYALTVPDALLDAARMDGASEWRIYRSVVLPLLRPILVTLGVFTFMATWNDFMWPLVALIDGDMRTLPVALAVLSGEHVQDTELMMAGSVVTLLPVLLLFLLVQRYYVAGIVAGSIKE